MDKSDSTLEAAGLTKIYPSTHGERGGVRDLGFRLEPGTFFTLLGPSGCGKTTTLRCLAGLEQPDEGTIRLGEGYLFDSRSGVNVPLNRRDIGMVFQSYAIWPHMSVFENVAFPLRVSRSRSSSAGEIAHRVGEALETVDMAAFAQRSATQLSGGQQQRVALARAIVGRPQLLLLDEPLSNLDARLRDEMRGELKRLQRQLGTTTVYVTHDQSEALDLSDTIAVMNRGRLVQIGPPRDIYFKPKDTFVAQFMGAANILEGNLGEGIGEGGLAKVTLRDGSTLVARFPYAVAGGRVAISVRPEGIVLRSPAVPAGPGGNRIVGVVVATSFLGHVNRHQIDFDGLLLQANTDADATFVVGEGVALDFTIENTLGLAYAEDSAPAAAGEAAV